MSDSFQSMCTNYFARLKAGNQIRTGVDTAKARNSNIAAHEPSRVLTILGDSLKSEGPDVVSNFDLDIAMVKAYQKVPIPSGKELKLEYHFLMFEENGAYRASRFFETPENGGAINYSCLIDSPVDWEKVVAAAHTHPLYKDRNVNRLNQYFSQGDPAILIIKNIPLFLRTPKGEEIKVLEIRNGWVTTRTITTGKGSKPVKWRARA